MGLIPGLLLCLAVSGAAYLLESLERATLSKAWLEALVIAILLGTAIRTFWSPGQRWLQGIEFSAKYLLEIAVVLLGASLSTSMILAAGPALLLAIAVVVTAAISLSFAIGRLMRLPTRMALLVACGNSICGNSAIAAVAPIIKADAKDVAASIAFTAVLGVVVVLALPLLGIAWGMSELAYGAFAGLTVYAVPQVIAAASPFGPTAVQMGTLVKLVRVLMLGPVCLLLSLVAPRMHKSEDPVGVVTAGEIASEKGPPLGRLIPWFIVGFLALAACRSFGLLPTSLLPTMSTAATVLTVISMAALGLGVDIRTVAKAGVRVTVTVVLSLVGLGVISRALLGFLRLA